MTARLIDSVASTTSLRDRDDLDVSVARLLVEFFHARSAAIYRLLEDGATTRVARRIAVIRGVGELDSEQIGDLTQLPPLDIHPAWQQCVRERRMTEHQVDGRLHYVFPIESEVGVVGMLVIEPRRALRPRDQLMMGGILRIVKNHLSLLDYGECDSLTGLMNRKTFETSFYKLQTRANKDATSNDEPSWLGIVDIDKFKSINDNYGHLFGDEVLLLVSRLMKETFRGADQLFRFGGEEFVVVLDRATPTGAQIAFERLRAAIDKRVFPQVGNVTVSLGYTRIEPRDAPSTCVERADAALYYAKQNGRNNVRHHEALVASGELKAATTAAADSVELF